MYIFLLKKLDHYTYEPQYLNLYFQNIFQLCVYVYKPKRNDRLTKVCILSARTYILIFYCKPSLNCDVHCRCQSVTDATGSSTQYTRTRSTDGRHFVVTVETNSGAEKLFVNAKSSLIGCLSLFYLTSMSNK